MNKGSQNKKEEEREKATPKTKNEKKYDLSAYKSREKFQVKETGFRVRGTGTPAEDREENRSAEER